jgi:D-glycero-D-manno-heptose 1,7-bisphosphate phosphatase
MNIVLLDRDGTIIKDPLDERVDREDKIELFPDSIEALKYLADNDFAIIIITNQAGISEGRINAQDFDRIHGKVLEMLASSGVKILKTFMCPHGPNDGCDCRKPKPTMILDAAKEFNLDLAKIYMVGDNISDIDAGINAGTKTVLVETATNKKVVAEQATYSAPNLLDAVKYVVSHS